MKKILCSLLTLAGLCILAACDKGDVNTTPPQGEDEVLNLSSISISLTDAGFISAGTAGLYTRDFTAGDRIGVFAVREGVVVEGQSNLCYEAADNGNGGIIWTPAGENNAGTFFSDALYFVYYPYEADFAHTVDCAAEDARGFFAGLLSAHETACDQSEKAAYDASDLMAGCAAISGNNSVSVEMEHLMSLVVIELPSEYYAFDNSDPAIPDYVLSCFTDASFEGFEPYSPDDYTFMYILTSGETAELSGAYGDPADGVTKTWSERLTPEAGCCYTVSVGDGKSSFRHTLSPGDFFLADGRLLSKDAAADEVAAADVIGIVFQTDPERMDPAIADSLGGVPHALVLSVMALKSDNEDPDLYTWGPSRDETVAGLSDTYGGYDLGANYRLIQRDIYGYSNTELLRSKRQDFPDDYPVFLAVESFDSIIGGPLESAPANTGWYLPSAGEWLDIIRNLTGLTLDLDSSELASDGPGQVFWSGCGEVVKLMNGPLEKIPAGRKDDFFTGGAWWTSSICGTDSARVMAFNNEGYVHCRWTWRSVSFYARAVLAF